MRILTPHKLIEIYCYGGALLLLAVYSFIYVLPEPSLPESLFSLIHQVDYSVVVLSVLVSACNLYAWSCLCAYFVSTLRRGPEGTGSEDAPAESSTEKREDNFDYGPSHHPSNDAGPVSSRRKDLLIKFMLCKSLVFICSMYLIFTYNKSEILVFVVGFSIYLTFGIALLVIFRHRFFVSSPSGSNKP